MSAPARYQMIWVPVRVNSIPESVRDLVLSVKDYERLAIRAAVDNDSKYALDALSAHPLVSDRETARHLMDKLVLYERGERSKSACCRR